MEDYRDPCMFVVLMFYILFTTIQFFSVSVLPDKLEGLDSCPRSCKYLMYPFGRWTSETGWKPDVKGSQYTVNQYIFTLYSTFYVFGAENYVDTKTKYSLTRNTPRITKEKIYIVYRRYGNIDFAKI